MEASYSYMRGEDIDDGCPDGWYDDEDGETLVTKTFDIGEGFFVYAGRVGTLTYAGQVVTEQTSVPVRMNLSSQGNFRATGVDIQKIQPVVADGVLASSEFTIQIYGSTGILEASYSYMRGEDIDDGCPDGWYDDEDGETLVEKTFNPGEGFNVYAGRVGTLVFPALAL